MYLLVEESRQTLCGGLGGGVCHLDLQLGLVGQAVAEEGGRAPAHGRCCSGRDLRPTGAQTRASSLSQLSRRKMLVLPLPPPRFTIIVSVP